MKELFADVMEEAKGKISSEELKSFLSALSFLGVELSKKNLIALNREMKRVFGEDINPKVLIDYLFLVIQVPAEEIAAAIPEIKNYLQDISEWSASRTLIDPKDPNYEASYRCRKISPNLPRKVKILTNDINLYQSPIMKNKITYVNPSIFFFFYSQMALDESKDAGLREYAAVMKNYYSTEHNEFSCISGHIYDDFEYAGSSVIKQWAILVEHNLPPADKELYTDCHALLRKRRNFIKSVQRKTECPPEVELPTFLDSASICAKTGWMFEDSGRKANTRVNHLLNSKEHASNESNKIMNTIIKLELERDTYTVIEKGKLTKKLLGIENVAKRQLEKVGGYNVISMLV
eukprot:TRINITY_DN12103_c0_g1_i1.p1 TRINITY_DN12103_c0_g1~~TRINITY_DN12103_c0_g1_i1.p1  ORF type:complete len:348 (+),score=57.66 TRINITY_DN12103_c0_g1_i1:64-1107(+)